jgi:DNA-binding MarR family transcriptional regulator
MKNQESSVPEAAANLLDVGIRCIYNYFMRLPPLPCACANLRRATRAVTQIYEEEFRPARLRITQFSILKALSTVPDARQGGLAYAMGLDSTTLTRTLANLRRQGYVAIQRGRDRRERILSLTEKGKAKVDHLMPHWERAQKRVRDAMGKEYDQLQGLLHQLTCVVGSE